VLERVQNTIEKRNCIKMNTIFNGEFDKCANNNTKNNELFQTSNLHEWHIIKSTVSLEEFQERDSG